MRIRLQEVIRLFKLCSKFGGKPSQFVCVQAGWRLLLHGKETKEGARAVFLFAWPASMAASVDGMPWRTDRKLEDIPSLLRPQRRAAPGSSQMRLSTQLEEGVGRGEGQASR